MGFEKDFDGWNEVKKKVQDQEDRIFFHEREVWWCSFGINVGHEQDGKGKDFRRPAIVFKKFNHQVFWAIPLTTRKKVGKYYFPITMKDGVFRNAVLSQLRLIDSKRIFQKVGYISEDQHKRLIQEIIKICER